MARARARAPRAKVSRVRSSGARSSSACRRTSSLATWKPNSSTRRRSAARRRRRCARRARRAGCVDQVEVGEQLAGVRVGGLVGARAGSRGAPMKQSLRRYGSSRSGRRSRRARRGSSRSSRAIERIELGRHRRAKRVETAERARELAHLGAVARERELAGPLERPADRLGPASGCRPGRRRSSCRSAAAAAPPGAARGTRRAARGARRAARSKNHSPWRISSTTRGRRGAPRPSARARDLLGERVLSSRRARAAASAGRRAPQQAG